MSEFIINKGDEFIVENKIYIETQIFIVTPRVIPEGAICVYTGINDSTSGYLFKFYDMKGQLPYGEAHDCAYIGYYLVNSPKYFKKIRKIENRELFIVKREIILRDLGYDNIPINTLCVYVGKWDKIIYNDEYYYKYMFRFPDLRGKLQNGSPFYHDIDHNYYWLLDCIVNNNLTKIEQGGDF